MKNKELITELFSSEKIGEQSVFPPILVTAVNFPKVKLNTDTKIWLLVAHYDMSLETLKQELIKNLFRHLGNVYSNSYDADTYQDSLYSTIKKIKCIGHDAFVRQEDEEQFEIITDEIFQGWITKQFNEKFLGIETNEHLVIPALRALHCSAVLLNLFINPEEKALDILEVLIGSI